jgi:predicted Zn-dependent protease with MMP-like domain
MNGGPVIDLSRSEFDELVADALDALPPELARIMDNVAIFVEDDAPADDPTLLGLYEGVPLTERDSSYFGSLPDRITIYRLPTMAICDTADDVRAEVEITVAHEIAHHFGIAEERLHDLGYG